MAAGRRCDVARRILSETFVPRSCFLDIGIVALALVAGVPAVAQQTAESIADAVCRSTADWRPTARAWLRESYPNREETTARAINLLQIIGQRKGCPATQVSDFVSLAKVETCVIYPIDSVCLRRFAVPKDAHAFDLQPAGGQLYPGMRAVVPGDPRVTGGVGVRYNDALPASGDAISGLTGLRLTVPNGRWRVILVAGKRPLQQATATPFGSLFTANTQKFEVITIGPDRWIPRGAFSNLSSEQAFTPYMVLPGSAPAIVFDMDVLNGEAVFDFPQGAEVSIVYFEPADQPGSFVLDSTATAAVQTPDSCLAQQEALDRVANQIQSLPPVPPGRGGPPGSTPPGCAVGNCGGPVSKS
jgi:hypothetical protein